MRPATCQLLNAVDIVEACPGEECAFFDGTCLLTELRSDLGTNPALVHFLLGLRESLEPKPRAYVESGPGFD